MIQGSPFWTDGVTGMLVVETIARIRREHFVQGKAIKAIERDLKVSRNTVRKVIRSDATAFSYDRRSQPRPNRRRDPFDHRDGLSVVFGCQRLQAEHEQRVGVARAS